jgi:hypothetical protein
MTSFRIQALESLGFEWRICITTWEDRLNELTDYHKIHGHCNVPKSYSGSGNTNWLFGSQPKGINTSCK